MSFDFVDLISTLGFGGGICMHFLAWSKVLRKSRRLSTKEMSSLWRYLLLLGGSNVSLSLNRKTGTT